MSPGTPAAWNYDKSSCKALSLVLGLQRLLYVTAISSFPPGIDN